MAFETIPAMSTSTPIMTSGGGTNGMGMGGTAFAAGAGALIGAGLLGGGLFGGGGGVTVEKSIGDLAASVPAQTAALQHDLFTLQAAAADRGYQQTIAFGSAVNGIDKDVLKASYDSAVIALQNKYELSQQICNLDHHMEKCCCEQKELTLKMGYETQLRDACYKNDTDKQLAEIKCLISDTNKDGIIRQLQGQVAQMSQTFQTKSITDCIKDAFCKSSSAINQLGLNEQIINPDCKWPPYVPQTCCC